MTQAEQDQELADAREYFAGIPNIEVDRCRHPSVDQTTLWLFATVGHGKYATRAQVGAVTHTSTVREHYQWETTRMARGQPVARRCEHTLSAALAFILSYDWHRAA